MLILFELQTACTDNRGHASPGCSLSTNAADSPGGVRGSRPIFKTMDECNDGKKGIGKE